MYAKEVYEPGRQQRAQLAQRPVVAFGLEESDADERAHAAREQVQHEEVVVVLLAEAGLERVGQQRLRSMRSPRPPPVKLDAVFLNYSSNTCPLSGRCSISLISPSFLNLQEYKHPLQHNLPIHNPNLYLIQSFPSILYL